MTLERLIILTLCLSIGCSAPIEIEPRTAAVEHPEEFLLEGKVINPKCVHLLQASISEHASIIVRSVILETCQESNLAYEGQQYTKNQDGTILYCEDPEDWHSCFSYRVLGRTANGIFLLYHGPTIGAYEIVGSEVTFDFLEGGKQEVHVLTKLGESHVPCFRSAQVDGNNLKITKRVFDAEAPRAFQCKDEEETIVHSF